MKHVPSQATPNWLGHNRLMQSLHQCDLVTFAWCLRRRHLAQMTRLSRWVSHSADGHFYALTGLLALLTGWHDFAAVLSGALLAERTLYFLLKRHFRRNRPPQAIPGFKSVVQPSDQFSFPSGHTSAAFLFATLATAFMPGLSWLLFPWAASVAASRVLLGVHFPTDTLAGALLGYTIASLALISAGVA